MVQLTLKPEYERFIAEQLTSGRFSTPSEVIEAALSNFMSETVPDELDDRTIAALRRARAEFDRGEDRPFAEFAAELRAKLRGT